MKTNPFRVSSLYCGGYSPGLEPINELMSGRMSCHESSANCLSSTRLVIAPALVDVHDEMGRSQIPPVVRTRGGSVGVPDGVPVMITGCITVGDVLAPRV